MTDDKMLAHINELTDKATWPRASPNDAQRRAASSEWWALVVCLS